MAEAPALKRGGNAVDAAIACALVQTVADPQMCGRLGRPAVGAYGRGGAVGCTMAEQVPK